MSRAVESPRSLPCKSAPKVLEPKIRKKLQCHIYDPVTSSSPEVFLNANRVFACMHATVI